MTRLVLVSVVAAVASFAAVIVLSSRSVVASCLPDAPTEPAYTARFLGDVSMDQATHVVAVQHDGAPLIGARVCVYATKVGMSGLAFSDRATVVGPGRYAVRMQFSIGGAWQASVAVDPPHGSAVLIPVNFNVAQGSAAGIP